jgi:hypothetical protein
VSSVSLLRFSIESVASMVVTIPAVESSIMLEFWNGPLEPFLLFWKSKLNCMDWRVEPDSVVEPSDCFICVPSPDPLNMASVFPFCETVTR